MTAPDVVTRQCRGQALALDALTLAVVGFIGAGYAAARHWWAATAVITVATVAAWFVLRACARKVSGWNTKADTEGGGGHVDAGR